MTQPLEGWEVHPRPLLIGLAVFVGVLLLLVAGGGMIYKARFAPRTRPEVHRVPLPELETVDTAPDDQRQVPPPRPPAAIAPAMAATAAQGDALWGSR